MPTIRDSASASALQTLPSQEISTEVLIEKYAKDEETSIEAVNRRVARALAEAEPAEQRAGWEERFAEALRDGFVPAGRIQSAAGSGLAATLMLQGGDADLPKGELDVLKRTLARELGARRSATGAARA